MAYRTSNSHDLTSKIIYPWLLVAIVCIPKHENNNLSIVYPHILIKVEVCCSLTHLSYQFSFSDYLNVYTGLGIPVYATHLPFLFPSCILDRSPLTSLA
jgi:hypothetical protein